MNFDVYCDESHPDLLAAKIKENKYMVIGSLWLEQKNRAAFKSEIHDLKEQYKIGGEFKWNKVSPSRVDFYTAIIKWFFDKGNELRFRSIVVEASQVNLLRYHNNDQELGFYKFYYQMLHNWISDLNEYQIFCDYKSNRYKNRLDVLKDVLQNSNLLSQIKDVQSVKSQELVLIQLVDLLTGIVAAKFNNEITSSAKLAMIKRVEQRIGGGICSTGQGEEKFNVFLIDMKGGW